MAVPSTFSRFGVTPPISDFKNAEMWDPPAFPAGLYYHRKRTTVIIRVIESEHMIFGQGLMLQATKHRLWSWYIFVKASIWGWPIYIILYYVGPKTSKPNYLWYRTWRDEHSASFSYASHFHIQHQITSVPASFVDPLPPYPVSPVSVRLEKCRRPAERRWESPRTGQGSKSRAPKQWQNAPMVAMYSFKI